MCVPVNYWAVNNVTTKGAQKGVICLAYTAILTEELTPWKGNKMQLL